MDSLLNYFDAAYLINLPERKDRLKSASNEFARVGWIFGPSGVQLYSAQKFTDRAGFPFPNSRGCFHSHSECIRTAYLTGKQNVLLMEDDIALAPSISHLAPSIISQLKSSSWDFFYLGHGHTGEIGHANSRTSEVKLVPIKTEVVGAHFYAVNSRIFARLLEHLDRVAAGREGDQEFGPMPIDGAFNVFRRINSDVRGLMTIPKLGWQRPSRSDNHPQFFDQFRSLRPLVSLARNLKYTANRWRS